MIRCLRVVLALLAVSALPGCGGSDSVTPPAGDDPTGRRLAGTGPVADAADARERVLRQYLGLAAATRQATPGSPRLGGAADPFVDICEPPGNPHPAGTVINAGRNGAAATTLNDAYHLFWVDPRPEAMLTHPCFVVYVKAADGTIIEQPAVRDPTVNGDRPLFGALVRQDRRLYEHFAAATLRQVTQEIPPSGQIRATRQVDGVTVKGLSIGAGDSGGANRFFNTIMEDLFESINGSDTGFVGYAVDPPVIEDITAETLRRLLREASAGLGAGDKFQLSIMGHGEEAGIRLGKTFHTWDELADAIADEVAAGHINVIINACYAGTFIPHLQDLDDRTGKALRFLGTSDESHVAVDSFALELLKRQLESKLGEARELSPGLSLDELEDAFAGGLILGGDVEQFIRDMLDEMERDAPTEEGKAKVRAARDKVLENPSGDTSGFGFPATPPLGQ